MNSDFTPYEFTSKESAKIKIKKVREEFLSNVINSNFEKKSNGIHSYFANLKLLDHLLEKKKKFDALTVLKKLISMPSVLLSTEMMLIQNKELKIKVKKDILNLINSIVKSELLPTKLRYMFLLRLNRLEDRDITRIMIDFKSRHDDSEYLFKKRSYQYFTSYLSTWLDGDEFEFNRIEEARRFISSPAIKKMTNSNLSIFKYFYKGNSLKKKQITELIPSDFQSLSYLELKNIFSSLENLKFKQEVSQEIKEVKKPLYLLKKNTYESRLYSDYYGFLMTFDLLDIGAYELDNLWWFYEI